MKQVIVVNEELKLPRGKLAAQVAHAAVAALLEAEPAARKRWLEVGMPKVVLRVESHDELQRICSSAEHAGLPVAIIADAGHTVVEAGTVTCAGIGPATQERVDAITGDLKLVR